MTDVPPIDALPGYRRRIVLTPRVGISIAELEDDYHHMTVTLHHEAGVATKVEAETHRAPWTTCPGATAQLSTTFEGKMLASFAGRPEKSVNCTHLQDMAMFAAAHADDEAPLVYDAIVADPVDGLVRAELRVNGTAKLSWTLRDGVIETPEHDAGTSIHKIRPMTDLLNAEDAEAAKLFAWAIRIGRGRLVPLAEQSDAKTLPLACFTFQPHVVGHAVRLFDIRDFSTSDALPLDGRVKAAEGDR